jgi:hypothetical protein
MTQRIPFRIDDVVILSIHGHIRMAISPITHLVTRDPMQYRISERHDGFVFLHLPRQEWIEHPHLIDVDQWQ